jgi:L-ascorbate metabolism protein UlaG (beta-lactamase superfamily)
LIQQWPRVLAESFGLRGPCDVCAPSYCFPSHDLWHGAALGGCWLGQATCLLRVGGLNILTDPHFGEQAGFPLGQRTIGRRRQTALPCSVDALPPIDLVLLSHAHFDHWDKESLERIIEHSGSRASVVIPARTRRLLPRGFANVIELPWDRRARVNGLRITSIRPRHWGARWFIDRHRGYNSYVIDAGEKRVVFGGDTGHTDAFDHLADDGGVDLAILGIGNSDHWGHVHASPEEAADMARRMAADRLMPIHHSTFQDPSEARNDPVARVLSAWDEARIICSHVGESWLDTNFPASLVS